MAFGPTAWLVQSYRCWKTPKPSDPYQGLFPVPLSSDCHKLVVKAMRRHRRKRMEREWKDGQTTPIGGVISVLPITWRSTFCATARTDVGVAAPRATSALAVLMPAEACV